MEFALSAESKLMCRTSSQEGEDRQMDKPAQNIQDTFLNTARKDKATITLYLLSGVKLTGRIRSFDKYSVVLETNSQEQLIFKHAISTVVMAKSMHAPESRLHGEARPVAVDRPAGAASPQPEEPVSKPSGTEG